MAQLFLLVSQAVGTAAYQIWPHADQVPAGAVQEYGTYHFELRGHVGPAELYLDAEPLRREHCDDPGISRWQWEVGFHAGVVDLWMNLGAGVTHQLSFQTDPQAAKMTREHFTQMVAEILTDTMALLSISSYRWHLARGDGKDVPQIAQLEFLRTRLPELEHTVRQINQHPVRVLRSEPEVVPLHRARGVTAKDLVRSLTHGRVVHTGAPHLPPRLAGYIPEKIARVGKTVGVDIPEHRAIKAALQRWHGWLLRLADRLEVLGRARVGDEGERQLTQLWGRRCRSMARRILQLLALELFSTVSDSPAPMRATPVFRGLPAYRRFLGLYNEFRLGVAGMPAPFLGVPLARTYDLYEIWVFLRIVRAAVSLWPESGTAVDQLFTRPPNGLLTPRSTVTVKLRGDLTLSFQREYTEVWTAADGIGSYTRTMVPDMVLALQQEVGARLAVMDTKYRLGAQLSDAVTSAHLYRDSIVWLAPAGTVRRVVQTCYLVTPHEPERLTAPWQETRMPDRLFHPDFQERFRLGAFTMRPGIPLEVIRAWLVKVVDQLCGDRSAG